MDIDFYPWLEDLQMIAQHLGFAVETDKIGYSISYSQGDGANFEGSFCLSDKLHIKEHAPQDASLAGVESAIRTSKRVFWLRLIKALPCEHVSLLRPMLLENGPRIHINRNQSRYQHQGCMSADASDVLDHIRYELGDSYPDDDDAIVAAVDELEENIKDDARSLAQDFFRLLVEDYEYQCKDAEETAAAEKAAELADAALALCLLEADSETRHQVC